MRRADPGREAASAVGTDASVELRIVGPEGSPIDEGGSVAGELTFAEAVRRALSTDPRIQSALARVAQARAEADQARRLPNPLLGFVVRLGGGAPQIEASIGEEIVSLLQRPKRVSAADDRLRAAVADAVLAACDSALEVGESYVAVQAAEALEPLLEQRLELVRRLVLTAEARLEAGEGTRGDLVTLDAQRVELELSIDRARLEKSTGRLRLARRLGEPSSAAEWTLEAWQPPGPPRGSEDEWIAVALSARPELRAATLRLAALGDEQSALRFARWEGAGAGLDGEIAGGVSVGPAISTPLPILDAGDARRAAQEAQILESRHEIALLRRGVVEEVRSAYRTLGASLANLDRVERELLPLLQQRRRLTEDAYHSGLTDVTPLFLAEQDLRVAETRAIEVELQASLALLRLQRACGGAGVAAWIEQPRSTSPTERP